MTTEETYNSWKDPECVGWHTWLSGSENEMFFASIKKPKESFEFYISNDNTRLVFSGDYDREKVYLTGMFVDVHNPTEDELILWEIEVGVQFPIIDPTHGEELPAHVADMIDVESEMRYK